MPEGTRQGEGILVVGAGLVGAALSWIAARSGLEVLLVSVNRPASQATSMSAGVVRGAGPPRPPSEWGGISAEEMALCFRRVERGCELLREVLLTCREPVGFSRCRHEVVLPEDADPAWLGQVEHSLVDAGFPVYVGRSADNRPVLVRERDAVVHPRRLAFELIRLARARGASIRLGTALRRIVAESDEGVLVELDGGPLLVERVFWAGGRPLPGEPRGPSRTQIVLHQTFDPGRQTLDAIYGGADGKILLAPAPLRPGRVVLVRIAEEHPAGGLSWPQTPPSWDVTRGEVIRQRLAEVYAGPAEPLPSDPRRVVSLSGLSAWPVSAVLGLCAHALEGG